MIIEMTPICDWEGFWKLSNAREEVVLPRTNFPLCQIGAVDVEWGVLEACVLFVNDSFDIVRHLIIHLVKLWFEAPCCEVGINQPVRLQELLL